MSVHLGASQLSACHVSMMPPYGAQRELPRMPLPKLSEKGYEQHSERGFGRYKEGEMGQIVPSRRSIELHHRRVRGFSDSFSSTTLLVSTRTEGLDPVSRDEPQHQVL